jgi:hypothetical protein
VCVLLAVFPKALVFFFFKARTWCRLTIHDNYDLREPFSHLASPPSVNYNMNCTAVFMLVCANSFYASGHVFVKRCVHAHAIQQRTRFVQTLTECMLVYNGAEQRTSFYLLVRVFGGVDIQTKHAHRMRVKSRATDTQIQTREPVFKQVRG